MRKIPLLTLVFSLLCANAIAQKGSDLELEVTQTRGTINASISLDGYDLENSITKDGVAYSMLTIDGAVYTTEEGAPKLPFKQYNFQLAGNTNAKVEIVKSEYKEISVGNDILPARRTIYRNEDPATVQYAMGDIYNVDAFYPANQVNLLDPYLVRDARGVTLQVYPVQFNPVTNIVRIYTSLEVKITQEESAQAINAAPEGPRSLSPDMDNLYNNLFVNYSRWSNAVAEEGDMLVIHTARDKDAIKKYVDHKKSYNKYVKSVTTKEVSKGTNVKQVIKTAYAENSNLLYVQLVGDWADIKSDLGGGANAPMDPMLGCVKGTDTYPDIIIGRFSCDGESTLTPQIDKAIAYESNGVQDWMYKALGIASDEGAGSGDDGEADYQHMNIIKTNKLKPNGYTKVSDVYAPGAKASGVTQALNDGLGLINYVGHGSHTSFVTSGFSNTHISSLTNEAYPVIISVACVNGEFHKGGNCFGEAWLRQEDGGAVATVMATINQPWQPPMRGQDYMNDLIIGGYDYSSNPGNGSSTTEGRQTFGSVVFNGLVLMYAEQSGSSDLETIQTWTIFGDCALDLRPEAQTDGPTDITLSNTNVNENKKGAVIGAVTVKNSNSSATHTFTIDDSRFEIKDDTLQLVSDEFLNYEDEDEVTINITVKDSDNNSYSEDVKITVKDVNDAPVVSSIANQTIKKGSSFTSIKLSAHVEDEDHLDSEITWTTTTSSYIKVTIGTSSAYITVKDSQWSGSETITFTATDPKGASDKTDVTFTVKSVNEAPVVSPIPNQKVKEGGSFSFIKLSDYVDDPDNSDDEITWTTSTTGNYLKVVVTTSGAMVTVKDEEWNGTQKVTFKATDPGGLYDKTTVSFTVTPVNDAPVVKRPIADVAMKNSSVDEVDVSNVFEDVDDEVLTITTLLDDGEALPAWIDFDGTLITIEPDESVHDTFDILVTASDGDLSVTDTFELRVKDGVAIIEVDDQVKAGSELLFAPNPVPVEANEVSFVTPDHLDGEWKVAIYDNVGNLLDDVTFESNGGKRYIWDLRNKAGIKVSAAFYVAILTYVDESGKVHEFKRKIGVRR